MQIRELIKLWENGQTSPEQEALLREYFSHEKNVPEDLKPYRVLFCGISELANEKGPEVVLKKHKFSAFSYAGIAAALVLVCGLFFRPEPYCYVNGKAVRNPQEALAAVESLACLSDVDRSVDSLHSLEIPEYQYLIDFLTSK